MVISSSSDSSRLTFPFFLSLMMSTSNGRMQKRVFLFLLISVEIMLWISLVSARSLPQANLAVAAATKGIKGRKCEEVELRNQENGRFRELVRLGSRPPNCEHKCRGCEPCMAIQVPTTTYELKPLYANYEPEGWRCKCGSTFYNP